MTLTEKVTDIYFKTKKEVLNGELSIDDSILIDFLIAYHVGAKFRYDDLDVTLKDDTVELSVPYSSMREFTRDMIKKERGVEELTDADQDLLKTYERTNANRYNKLTLKTVKDFERRKQANAEMFDEDGNKKDGFKEQIMLFDFQHEKDFLLALPESRTEDEEKEYKAHQTTVNRLQKANFKKLRIPHLVELSKYYEKMAAQHPNIDNLIIHQYMIENSLNTEFYRAASRLLAKHSIKPDTKVATMLAVLKTEIKSFRIKAILLEIMLDPEWLTDAISSENEKIAELFNIPGQYEMFLGEVFAIRDLLRSHLDRFVAAGYFGTSYDDSEYELFKKEFDVAILKEIAIEFTDTKEEAKQFNDLKLEFEKIYKG